MVGAGVVSAASSVQTEAAPANSPTAPGGHWSKRVGWIDLWPAAAPGLPALPPAELVKPRPGTGILEVTGVSRPRLMVIRPERANGSAALVMPGGGYTRLIAAPEGPEIARWLAAQGWTVFVLLYRLPGDGWANRADTPLQDAQRAIRLIRSRAASFGIRPDRIAAFGSSAGGHLCCDLATRFAVPVYAAVDAADRLSARPDFAAAAYPVQTMAEPHVHRGSRARLLGADPSPELVKAHSPENNVRPDCPPFLLMHAEDDPTVSPENSLRMRSALKAAGVRVETHLFPDGGHGFGIAGVASKTTAIWPELLARSARSYGLG